jgi:putative transposon-encoded protein
MAEENFDIFFRRKPAMMVIALKKVNKAKYGSVLAKEVNCSYSTRRQNFTNSGKVGVSCI